jgi:ribosomal protein L7/L12
MQTENIQLPLAAIEAADRGNIVEAVKATRIATGLGLKESKDAIDAYLASGATTLNAIAREAYEGAPPATMLAALDRGELIGAIKELRSASGMGLKEAKESVEAYLAAHPSTMTRFRAANAERRKSLWKFLSFAAVLAALVVVYMALTGQLE